MPPSVDLYVNGTSTPTIEVSEGQYAVVECRTPPYKDDVNISVGFTAHWKPFLKRRCSVYREYPTWKNEAGIESKTVKITYFVNNTA